MNNRNYESKVKPMYQLRLRIFRRMKELAGCVDCGYSTHGAALDWDHRPDVDKKFAVTSSPTRNFESILEEMEKCDIRCANCHRIITAKRRTYDA